MKKIRVLLWLLVAALGAIAISCHLGRSKPNVILIIIDTARKDHFSCYGYSRQLTPRIDELAKDGVKFDNAEAAAPWTLPSIASILTGLYPHKHMAGYAANDPKTHQEGLTYINSSVITLAEVLFDNKYQTVGSFQNPFVDPGYGLNRGFEIYDYFPGDDLRIRRADTVVEWAMNWLEKAREKRRPFFMVLHFFDPHLAYDPIPQFASPFIYGYKGGLHPPFDPGNADLEKIRNGEIKYNDEDKKFIEGLYDGELSFVDSSLGRLFDFLKLNNLYDNTLIIVTGDHGEEFWDHNSYEHGHTLYQELLSMSLIVRFPMAENKGLVVKDRVSLVDIAPSILAYLRIESTMTTEGMSFIKMPGASIKPASMPIVAEDNRIGDPLQALYRGQYKLILNIATGEIQIYNLDNDPGEKTNLFGRKETYPPEIVDQIKGVAAKIQKLRAEGKTLPAKISPEIIEKLRALGYIK